eukprot:m.235404 g.235404  ORF g.235404 m.235404 type:complete len:151 (-) comp19336_c0_seq8:855-1307(-)
MLGYRLWQCVPLCLSLSVCRFISLFLSVPHSLSLCFSLDVSLSVSLPPSLRVCVCHYHPLLCAMQCRRWISLTHQHESPHDATLHRLSLCAIQSHATAPSGGYIHRTRGCCRSLASMDANTITKNSTTFGCISVGSFVVALTILKCDASS